MEQPPEIEPIPLTVYQLRELLWTGTYDSEDFAAGDEDSICDAVYHPTAPIYVKKVVLSRDNNDLVHMTPTDEVFFDGTKPAHVLAWKGATRDLKDHLILNSLDHWGIKEGIGGRDPNGSPLTDDAGDGIPQYLAAHGDYDKFRELFPDVVVNGSIMDNFAVSGNFEGFKAAYCSHCEDRQLAEIPRWTRWWMVGLSGNVAFIQQIRGFYNPSMPPNKPVQMVARSGNFEAVKYYILEFGKAIEGTPLVWAMAESGNVEATLKLIDSLDPPWESHGVTDGGGMNIAHYVAQSGNYPGLLELLKSHPTLFKARDCRGNLPWYYLDRSGNREAMRDAYYNRLFENDTSYVRSRADLLRIKRPTAISAILETLSEERRATFEKEYPWAVCSLSLGVMIEPVVVDSGFTYDRHEIERSLEGSRRDPMTRQKLSKKVVPNRILQTLILDTLEGFVAKGLSADPPNPAKRQRDSDEGSGRIV